MVETSILHHLEGKKCHLSYELSKSWVTNVRIQDWAPDNIKKKPVTGEKFTYAITSYLLTWKNR